MVNVGKKKEDLTVVNDLKLDVQNSNIALLENHKKIKEAFSDQQEVLALRPEVDASESTNDIVNLIDSHLENNNFKNELHNAVSAKEESQKRPQKNGSENENNTSSKSKDVTAQEISPIDEIEKQILSHIEHVTKQPDRSNKADNLEELVEQQNKLIESRTTVHQKAQALAVENNEDPQKTRELESLEHLSQVSENTSLTVSAPKENHESTLDKQRDLYHLNRFLDDREKPEPKLPSRILLMCCAALSIIGGAAGAYIAVQASQPKVTEVKIGSDYEQEVEYAKYMSSEQFTKPLVSEYDTANNKTPVNETVRVKKEDKVSPPQKIKKGGGDGTVKKASVIAAPVLTSVGQCAEPEINLSAMSGGRTRIYIKPAECDREKPVELKYAGTVFNPPQNENGEVNFVLDCFAGDKYPVEIIVGQRPKIVRQPVARDLESVSKVAVVWDHNINFDLHAFQYLKDRGQEKHIWENAPSSIEEASRYVQLEGSGRGFLTRYDKASGSQQNIEVYTFLHSDQLERQIIKLALGYRHNNQKLVQNVRCDNAQQNTVDYVTTSLLRNSKFEKRDGAVLVSNCQASHQAGKLHSKAIPDLIITD